MPATMFGVGGVERSRRRLAAARERAASLGLVLHQFPDGTLMLGDTRKRDLRAVERALADAPRPIA